jgi:Mg-chelatase subunit ChlD
MQHDFILMDRSQSMSSQWKEAIAAVNGYVKKLAEDKVDTGVTLAVFDKEDGKLLFEVLRERIIPSTWADVGVDEVHPRGMTPLNDAIGRIVSLANAGNYEKVAMIIMTDGAENCSTELSRTEAVRMLDDCRAKGWQVIFLGASYDNSAQAKGYGNAAVNTIAVGAADLGKAMRHTAELRASYASAGAAMAYSDADKAKLGDMTK